ncbi:MAG TPA: MarR family winged helix-turn-helix transcriptional regulator [Candidatus Limnocylindrales bacterium]|nr:MarR family winged helix-turn-helix transcriptional regulator [Candidatus Limnocylindrales bacterium]
MDEADDREELARRGWRLLMGAGQRHLEVVTAGIEEMGLSKVMAQFLGAVCQSPPGPTNQLATRFGVDPGWVTDIVDRLEARGQLVRRQSPNDRRVKILDVTEAGRETFRAMEAIFATPPPELLDASREDLLALVRIAERLAGPIEPVDAVDP